jgi:hypothetical protein
MTWPTWLTHNPLAWTALANGIVDAAIAFGLPITDPEKLALGGLIGLVSTLFVQSQVTSTAKLASLGVTIQPATTTQVAVLTPPTPLPFPPAVTNASKVTIGTTAVTPVPVNPQVPPAVPPAPGV